MKDEEARRCAYCGMTGPAPLFEKINDSGAVACRARAACEIRQAGEDPVFVLGHLLRDMRLELSTLNSEQLANLYMDSMGFFHETALRLSMFPDNKEQVDAVRRDRAQRAQQRRELDSEKES